MRSRSFLRKSQQLIKPRATVRDINVRSPLNSRPQYSLRNTLLRSLGNSRAQARFLSASAVPPLEPSEDSTTTASKAERPTEPESVSEIELSVEETEKPIKIKRTRSNASPSSSSTVLQDSTSSEFPQGLDSEILFVPSESLLESSYTGLPPPEIFEEALDKLLITLHQQNQARSLLSSTSSPIEPTLGLYCPIEGGDVFIDNTVHELAFRTGSEVLVLDAVQLAAGEWGRFGQAARVLDLSPNPLHFSAHRTQSSESSRRKSSEEEQVMDQAPFIVAAPSRLSLNFPKALASMSGRVLMSPSSRKPPSPSKLDLFFDALVNMPCPKNLVDPSGQSRRRLIYIRDFPTLAPSSSLWYPSLLAAVRQRRRGVFTRPASPSSSPVTIIFGMSPSIAHPRNDSSPGSRSSLLGLLMNRNSSSSRVTQGLKTESLDFTESEAAQAAREKRLRKRLRKWEWNPAALQEEYPKLRLKAERGDNNAILPMPELILIGGPEGTASLEPAAIDVPISDSDEDPSSQFFRSAVLVPHSRSLSDERESRMARRREINELTMRMGVGAIGGVIDTTSFSFPEDDPVEEGSESQNPDTRKSPMWKEWGDRIESWSNVRKIADRAIGSVMVQQQALNRAEKPSFTPTLVPWSAVESAWTSCSHLGATRTSWLKQAFGDKLDETQDGPEEKTLDAPGSSSDKVVERLKDDPDLDQHEARLLPCIVDANSLTTTFGQVHLPSQTIDAVRTIVSLPLLHPHAFKQGILKEHGMTGCLLFGPPGTGKTLVVRALAKEAGCRMLVVSPSDVMDMYVGEGEKLVRAVFALARKLSPCVVFLDEIDALFGARMSARESGSAFAHRGVITEFMQEMDGLKNLNEHNVIVIGATNRPFDLDDAVLRRLPRRLLVDLPGEKEREEILKILLRDEALADNVNLNGIAKETDGFSGSDLKHLCVSAALDSVKEHVELPWVSRHMLNTSAQSVPVISVEVTSLGVDASKTTKIADGTTPTTIHQEPKLETMPESKPAEAGPVSLPPRVLHVRHFTQAMKEIIPSSSEALGSLTELRKWNEEFGEGKRENKKRQVWGKGRFGFVNGRDTFHKDGRVAK